MKQFHPLLPVDMMRSDSAVFVIKNDQCVYSSQQPTIQKKDLACCCTNQKSYNQQCQYGLRVLEYFSVLEKWMMCMYYLQFKKL